MRTSDEIGTTTTNTTSNTEQLLHGTTKSSNTEQLLHGTTKSSKLFTEKDSNSKKTGMKVKWKGVERKGNAVNLKKTTQGQNRH